MIGIFQLLSLVLFKIMTFNSKILVIQIDSRRWDQDAALVPESNPVPGQPGEILGCSDLCTDLSGADSSRPTGAAVFLAGVKGKVSPCLRLSHKQPEPYAG